MFTFRPLILFIAGSLYGWNGCSYFRRLFDGQAHSGIGQRNKPGISIAHSITQIHVELKDKPLQFPQSVQSELQAASANSPPENKPLNLFCCHPYCAELSIFFNGIDDGNIKMLYITKNTAITITTSPATAARTIHAEGWLSSDTLHYKKEPLYSLHQPLSAILSFYIPRVRI